MLWTMFSYIMFWVAVFCWIVMGLLFLSRQTESRWIKKQAARFAQNPEESSQMQGLMKHLGILFVAVGILFFLLSTPTADMMPEQRGKLNLLEVLCVVVVFWQARTINNGLKIQNSGTVMKPKK